MAGTPSPITVHAPPLCMGEPGFTAPDFTFASPHRHVVSLGTHCYTVAMLQRLGWRRGALPFDWLFSSPRMVRHCIADGFATLTDLSLLQPVPLPERKNPLHQRCNHQYYRDGFDVPNVIFNHHDVWTPAGHAQLCRSAERFRAIAAGTEPALMIQMREARIYDAIPEFEATAATLDRHAPCATLVAISVRFPRKDGKEPAARLLARSGRHALFDFLPASVWDPLKFRHAEDEACLGRLLNLFPVELAP